MKIFSLLVIGCILFLDLSCSVVKLDPTTPITTTPITTTPITPAPTEKTTPSGYAEWTFNDLTITPSEAEVGQEVVVSVWLNVYGAIGEPLGKALLVIDGQVVATKNVWLTADSSELVSFRVVADEIGTHEVRLTVMLDGEGSYEAGVNDLTAELIVKPTQE